MDFSCPIPPLIKRIEERLSALGNCIACNDHVALTHPTVTKYVSSCSWCCFRRLQETSLLAVTVHSPTEVAWYDAYYIFYLMPSILSTRNRFTLIHLLKTFMSCPHSWKYPLLQGLLTKVARSLWQAWR